MKYRVSTANRWEFWETYTLRNATGATIDLEFCCKYGSVIVDVPENYVFDDTFNSEDFDNDTYQIEETGDESLEDWDIYGPSDEEAQALRQELEEKYDPESDDYYDFREYLENSGWEFEDYAIQIPSVIVEPYENE